MTRTLRYVAPRPLRPRPSLFGQPIRSGSLTTFGTVIRIRLLISAGYGCLLPRHMLDVVSSLLVTFLPVPRLLAVRPTVRLSIPLPLPLTRLWSTLLGLMRLYMSTVMVFRLFELSDVSRRVVYVDSGLCLSALLNGRVFSAVTATG